MTDENNAALGEGSERRREADGEVAGNRRRSGRSDKFNKLPPLDIEELGGMHKSLELGHKDDRNVFRGGVLPNGLRYFIRRNKHPKRRCALALAVKAGSVHEEDSEQGVAHILEHLAFRSTKRFNNYDIVKFLESIGADFGADQNAYTAFDETVYELFVPCEKEEEEEEEEKEEESTARKTDNTKSEKEEEEGSDGDRNMPTLERALLVLSEFANGIRAEPEDLETERGTVLEEWRQSRNNQSRMVESHWKATMKGSKYESRLPIGLEKVIREVTSDEVKEFRDKWYTPNHMGVILVGDFAQNIGEIEKMVVKAFDSAPQSSDGTDNYLNVNVPVHEQPQYLIMTDEEATASSVNISFVKPIDYGEGNGDETWNLSTYREMLVEDMFDTAMNSILFRRSHGSTSEKQPFFSASFGNDHVCRNADHASFTARCKSGGTLEAIESLLIELARIRTRGFERREIEAARIQLLSDAETSYVESGKAKSEDLRDEYLGHFLRGEPVLDIVTEARINVMLLKDIKAEEVQALASRYTHSKGMVIQTIEPPNDGVRRTKEDIAKIVEKVGRMEMNREIGKHPDDDKRMSPEDLLPEEALNYQNSVRFQHDIKSYPALEAKQTVLSNGMSVCWRRSTLNDDQVLVYAFARGGLSQEIKGVEGDPSVAEMLKLRTASIGSLFASDVGVFGVKPWLLSDALAGIRCGISPNVRGYMRSFGGEQSSSDFETSLRLIHLLFKTEVKVIDSELATLKQMVRESIQNQIRDPVTKYAQRLKFVNYGKSFYFRPWTLSEFESIDAHKSCKYFSGCFENPGQFTLIIIGDIDEISGAGTDKDFLEMLEKYVGSIEVKDASANTPVDIKDLVPIPFSQPSQIHRETVIAKMVDPMSATQVTFPVGIRKVPYETALADSFWICFCCNLLEQRLMHQMRFARGEIYSVSVSPSFAVESPSFPFEVVRGDVVIAFSCEPGGSADSLITLALDEVQNLRTKPATQEEIDSLLEVEKRSYEVAMEDNSFWQDCLITAHQSRMYRETKDLDKAYLFRKKIRDEVLSTINPETMMKHFRDFFKSREECIYSAITLEPDSSVSFASRCLSSIYNHIPSLELTSSLSQSKLLLAGSLAAAAVAAGALYYIRHSKA